jgi:hypothetical protein
VIEWLPTVSIVVLNVALPVESSTPVPKTLLPSRNVTVPVGIPEPGVVQPTVAVKVIA